MNDLVEFLQARLDEDEQMARAAAPAPWNAFIGSVMSGSPPNDEEFCDLIPPGESEGDDASAEHIARHDPARVLREVEAKRRILEILAEDAGAASGEVTRQDFGSELGRWTRATAMLRILASVYADNADYQQKWRP